MDVQKVEALRDQALQQYAAEASHTNAATGYLQAVLLAELVLELKALNGHRVEQEPVVVPETKEASELVAPVETKETESEPVVPAEVPVEAKEELSS
jgi:hypothetical protein